ncbi:MAG: hypothetical protein WAW02_10600 [Sideroxyarcus sp.]
MNIWQVVMRCNARLGFIAALGMSLIACSPADTWKEEVLLHDGSKIIVERTQHFGGILIQSPPIKEHSVTFTLPDSDKSITWKSNFSEDIGHSNFGLLALDIVNGSAYVVADLTGCLSYNKWGRPNPPYIFFKYANEQWTQIPLGEFPVEIEQPNMLIDTFGHGDVNREVKSGYVTAENVKKINSTLTQEEFKNIVRLPVKKVSADCGVMVRIEGTTGGWGSPGGAKAPVPIISQNPTDK